MGPFSKSQNKNKLVSADRCFGTGKRISQAISICPLETAVVLSRRTSRRKLMNKLVPHNYMQKLFCENFRKMCVSHFLYNSSQHDKCDLCIQGKLFTYKQGEIVLETNLTLCKLVGSFGQRANTLLVGKVQASDGSRKH